MNHVYMQETLNLLWSNLSERNQELLDENQRIEKNIHPG
jgi:hypothetical protein